MPARVLVVRDDSLREPIVNALRDAGINVVGFDDPAAVLDGVDVEGRAELLITKLAFASGKQNGLSLALMLKTKRRKLRVLFVGMEKYRQFVTGVGEFLPAEPLDMPLIVQTARRLLDQPGK